MLHLQKQKMWKLSPKALFVLAGITAFLMLLTMRNPYSTTSVAITNTDLGSLSAAKSTLRFRHANDPKVESLIMFF